MAISDELTRIQTAKADIKASIEAKGVTVPSDALIDTYSDYVDEIQTGGGGGQAEQDLKDLIERDITSLTIPKGTTKIGDYAFGYCSSLTSIIIPNGVTSIGLCAFKNCSNLTSVTIPSRVTEINNNAFQQCTLLTSVTIGNGVTSISGGAFQNCSALRSVTVEATTPPTLGSSVFYNTNNCPIYVPAESVAAYKAATNWSSYASRIQAIQ